MTDLRGIQFFASAGNEPALDGACREHIARSALLQHWAGETIPLGPHCGEGPWVASQDITR